MAWLWFKCCCFLVEVEGRTWALSSSIRPFAFPQLLQNSLQYYVVFSWVSWVSPSALHFNLCWLIGGQGPCLYIQGFTQYHPAWQHQCTANINSSWLHIQISLTKAQRSYNWIIQINTSLWFYRHEDALFQWCPQNTYWMKYEARGHWSHQQLSKDLE